MIRAACADLASWPPLSAVWGGVAPRNQHAPGAPDLLLSLPQFPPQGGESSQEQGCVYLFCFW